MKKKTHTPSPHQRHSNGATKTPAYGFWRAGKSHLPNPEDQQLH